MVQDLRRVGVGLRIKSYTFNEYFVPTGPLYGGRFDVALSEFGASGEPDLFAQAYLSCTASNKPTIYNFQRFCSPQIQAAIDDALSTLDTHRQQRDYETIQRVLRDDVPIVILATGYIYCVITKRLQNFDPGPTGFTINVNKWWLN